MAAIEVFDANSELNIPIRSTRANEHSLLPVAIDFKFVPIHVDKPELYKYI